MSLRNRILLLLGVLAAATANGGAIERSTSALPDLGPPPQGEAQWIARSMRHNGLPMTLKAFRSRLSADEVLEHYARFGNGSARESMRSRQGEWQVLAIKDARCFITIQARDSAPGSVGMIAVTSDPANIAASIATRFPLPRSMHIVNLQQYEDEGEQSEHISLISAKAPHVEAENCARLLSRDGWQLLQDAPARTIERGYLIEAQKGAEHARLTFMPDQSGSGVTAIIIVWRKA